MENKEWSFRKKIRTVLITALSILSLDAGPAVAQIKERATGKNNKIEEVSGFDIENGKKNLRIIFQSICRDRIDRDGDDLLVHLGGPDGFFRLRPALLKELVIICDKKTGDNPVLLKNLKIIVIDKILTVSEKIKENELTQKFLEIKKSAEQATSDMKQPIIQ
ncbi:MAG: hypothetical protein WCO84_00730 [bacterium]